MNYQSGQLGQLERTVELLRLDVADLRTQMAQALQQIRDAQTSQLPVTVTTISTYEVAAADAVVIAGGGNATGVAITIRTGASTSSWGSATVYNDMQTSTVTGKTIILSPNGDGSFTAVTQSC